MEPFGEEAAFWRSGMLAALLANVNRDPKRRKAPYVPADFMPDPIAPPERAPTPEERGAAVRARIDAAMLALGGTVAGDKPSKPGRVQAEHRPK